MDGSSLVGFVSLMLHQNPVTEGVHGFFSEPFGTFLTQEIDPTCLKGGYFGSLRSRVLSF